MDIRPTATDLYPEIEPYEKGMLAVDDRHTLYWEQSGNPDGRPVLFIHGGPGAGAAPAHRRFFDPRFYRIVVFDQRGCGRSQPYAELTDNTTDHLIADIERLRRHLGIEAWMVFGGSWGATLALAYGVRHPERCTGFVLRGVFLGTRGEVQWFLAGMGTVFPEAWRRFRDFLAADEHGDLLAAYHRRLTDDDPAVHGPAADAWSRYEASCSNLIPPAEELRVPTGAAPNSALALARIEAHYFVNDAFLSDAPLMDGLRRLHGIPAVVVQGRYDMVCPIVTADALVRAWPGTEYAVVADGGHSAMEPGIRAALVRATEVMKHR